jgi:hypothetical protein
VFTQRLLLQQAAIGIPYEVSFFFSKGGFMDNKILHIFCLCDDLLKILNFRVDPQCKMNGAEILTLAIGSALFFGGNFSFARRFFKTYGYIPKMLSRSRLNKKLLAFPSDILQAIFHLLSCALRSSAQHLEYVIDSFPVAACHSCRSWRCKLYTGTEYIGYCATKKWFYYGLKVHMITTVSGIPVEFCFTPASTSDLRGLQSLPLDLPPNAFLYADRAYNSYAFEDELKEDIQLSLISQRKKTHKRQHIGPIRYLQGVRRKRIETVFSQMTRLFPRSICARTPKCFELKIFLFILAFVIEKFSC